MIFGVTLFVYVCINRLLKICPLKQSWFKLVWTIPNTWNSLLASVPDGDYLSLVFHIPCYYHNGWPADESIPWLSPWAIIIALLSLRQRKLSWPSTVHRTHVITLLLAFQFTCSLWEEDLFHSKKIISSSFDLDFLNIAFLKKPVCQSHITS